MAARALVPCCWLNSSVLVLCSMSTLHFQESAKVAGRFQDEADLSMLHLVCSNNRSCRLIQRIQGATGAKVEASSSAPGCSARAERQAASKAAERASSRSAASAALGAARSASACRAPLGWPSARPLSGAEESALQSQSQAQRCARHVRGHCIYGIKVTHRPGHVRALAHSVPLTFRP